MSKYTTITVSAKRYEDSDNCLREAAIDYADEHGLDSWQVEAAWTDEQRETITLSVPASAAEVQ